MKPHWDYINPNGWENGYRIYEDNSWERKIFDLFGGIGYASKK